MKRFVFACAVIATSFVGCRSGVIHKPLDSLRVIKIGRSTFFGKQTELVLGSEMPAHSDFCGWSGATCNLKPGTFGGTDSMSLSKTASGQISMFHFEYGAMSNDAVNAQIDDYIQRLGKPTNDSTARNGETEVHKLTWADSATTFELTYRTGPADTVASASLFDNSLARPGH